MNGIPRPEHPQPQLQRKNWENLNGEWEFAFDFGKSGMNRRFWEREHLDQKILVPFCPESELSGIGYKDFIPAVWYKRKIRLEAGQLHGCVLLHFGAVDYDCRVWINGREAGRHRGGYTSFVFDITEFVSEGENDLTVYAQDDTRSGRQPKGKQSTRYESFGCDYTRTTGIWQTVWLEFVPKAHIRKVWYDPNLDQKCLGIRAVVTGAGVLKAEAFYGGKRCGAARMAAGAGNVLLNLPLDEMHLWEPGQGRLYDLKLTYGQDEVQSYFGMREIVLDGERVRINGKSVFQRLVLDQGFYPDGIWTAPTDEALKHDIELSIAAGFNGARLHQKVFEPRFHYWADRLGYLTWGESASWGANINLTGSARNFLTEWEETVIRDRNHPSIIIWTPFNETWEHPDNREAAREACRFVEDVYELTKNLDYRPCHDVSGNYHVMTDIFSVHQYMQDPAQLREWLAPVDGKVRQHDLANREVEYDGQPYLVDEYGGIKWVVGQEFSEISWGYGDAPKTLEEFYARLEALTDVILSFDHICGYCYTQLTDVEQEQNGIYNYDRSAKFDMDRIRTVFSKVPEGFK